MAAGSLQRLCDITNSKVEVEPKSEEALKPISERPVAKIEAEAEASQSAYPGIRPLSIHTLPVPIDFAKYGSRMAEVEAYRRKPLRRQPGIPSASKLM